MMLFGAIEAGGTKCVCAVGNEQAEILASTVLLTEGPVETFDQIASFFKDYDLKGIGIGMFGPIHLNPTDRDYGKLMQTPKQAWRGFNVYRHARDLFKVPVKLDTDVNVAALAESVFGAAKEAKSCLYMTVGTGIGAGYVKDGRAHIGTYHPEMGHMFVNQHPDDPFAGVCPSHGNCLEGLASGPSLEARYGKSGKALSDVDQVWEMEAYYLAQAVVNQILMLSPEKIILGGGVMKQRQLLSMVQAEVVRLLNGYVPIDDVTRLLVAPELSDRQGIIGALSLVIKDGNFTDKNEW